MRAWLFVSALMAGGCNDVSICGSHLEPVYASDGSPHRCYEAKDCPRPVKVSVCVTDVTPEAECMDCIDTACARRIPEPCS